ncbi:hypothetical protein BOTBODRAFT_35739 [Botryobasidium botryosum FD-172 SS1]|uniref:Uncharacterized protein n=1 Tax=Botryobasidium botryosum (strain FD-172 SS1) TaxID=930990 RepID=A0A067MHE1_BOTB1|nr:hypothetical protein BOTBODRAFT_35739 [Botryobasidium botryosum FD-172 SS1]
MTACESATYSPERTTVPPGPPCRSTTAGTPATMIMTTPAPAPAPATATRPTAVPSVRSTTTPAIPFSGATTARSVVPTICKRAATMAAAR